ncbi:hypothetical protein SASPL_153570 [Salvia splendens]|uniref:Uncharacterized protein n=1 Tax=Salvia splendens TaxID=180675 RepID=A0A8X8YZ13_SALSN|nr:hypothetical protein SASPL_153570 [Salvia splendens]
MAPEALGKAATFSTKAPYHRKPPPARLTPPQIPPVTLPPLRPSHAAPLRQGRLFYNNRNVAFAPYGEYWRQIRSVCVLHLLSNKRVQVALGKKYGVGSDFKEWLTEMAVLMGVVPLWEYIPWLSWTRRFDGVDERIMRVVKKINEFFEVVIQEHRVRERRESDAGGLDFMDILLDFQRENASHSPIEDDTIKAIIMDMFGAGTNTTLKALEWAMSELIRNPTTMKTLQDEVREVAGSKDEIGEQDLDKMPYLKAVLKESLRLHTPVPLLLPRESTQDTNVLGYDIASGTRVIVNAWAISRDPLLWENPEEFRPDRFLETGVDFRGVHFEFTPFGAGRRGCPGVTFAVAVDELALAKLVHKFDFGLPNGVNMEELDMNESRGMTTHKKCPFACYSYST